MRIAAENSGPGGVTEGDVRCLRRHARALTGSQVVGDALTLRCLQAVVADPARVRHSGSAKVALFAVLYDLWQGGDWRPGVPDTALVARAEHHLAQLAPRSRVALLLRSIEAFALRDIAAIMQLEAGEVGVLIREAEEAMMESVAGRVMVIEDDPIAALDLQGIVAELGHEVTGVAATRAEAITLAGRVRPDLVLADVQLADRSSGIGAVQDILSRFAGLPVIFVTGHPEQLLTGRGAEPAFVITKPFTPDQVRSAVSQAMFFASTEAISGDADVRRVMQ